MSVRWLVSARVGGSIVYPGEVDARRAERRAFRTCGHGQSPSAENPQGYHRLIGGSVNLGEPHRDAIVREVDEELGATIRSLGESFDGLAQSP